MSLAIISPQKLSGTVKAPPSKSELHRAIICAALADGGSSIYPVERSSDVLATINAVRALGAYVEFIDGKLFVKGGNIFNVDRPIIDCDESASTLRFLMPLATFNKTEATFSGKPSLAGRPLDVYLNIFPAMGVDVRTHPLEGLPLKISGRLRSGKIMLPGNVSSQFITGLLFALPLLSSDSEIILTTPLESAGYVDMTIDVMRKFSVIVQKTNTGFFVKGNQTYKPTNYQIEGDWSSASFWILAGALGGNIDLEGLKISSKQPDRSILSVMSRFGVRMGYKDNKLKIRGGTLRASEIYSAQFPDLVPVLSVLAAKSTGLTKIWGASRLRLKESDRINSICTCLKQIGVNTESTEDGILISGHSHFTGTRLDCFKDHRIVMAMAIAATVATNKFTLIDAHSVNKSYPEFFETFERLGGLVNVIHLD